MFCSRSATQSLGSLCHGSVQKLPLSASSRRWFGRIPFVSCYGTVRINKALPASGRLLDSPARLRVNTTSRVYASSTSARSQPPATLPPPPPGSQQSFQSGIGRTIIYATLATLVFGTGYFMATSPLAEVVLHPPPSDAETLVLYKPEDAEAEHINEILINHPLAQALRDHGGFSEARPHLKIPEGLRSNNLTGGTLAGKDRMGVPPLIFTTPRPAGYKNSGEGSPSETFLPEMICLIYMGPALCGHPGIVHGGFLATMLDEGLARACFAALPHQIGMTASLKIDYKKPCKAEQIVVLRAKTVKVDGRKAWVEGWIEEGSTLATLERQELSSAMSSPSPSPANSTRSSSPTLDAALEPFDPMARQGALLCKAEGLFIEPRGAAAMAARFYASAAGNA